jgi:integrase/recombinase XerD
MNKKNEKAKIRALLFPKPYSNGEFPLFIQIYFKGKRSYIKSGYSIPSGAWNEENAEVWESMPSLTAKKKESYSKDEIKAFRAKQKGIKLLPNAHKINSDIRGIISQLEDIETKLKALEGYISSEVIKSLYEGDNKTENSRKDFLQYINEIADRAFQKRQIRTSEKYHVMLRKLKAFRNDKPLPIDELNPSFLNEFQLYLQKDGKHINYIHVNLKALKTIIGKEAIRTDQIISPEKNPFLYFEMPKVLPTKKERLSIKEIEALEALKIPEDSINYHIKNIFLFSLYNAGIRIGDLLQLKWINISDGRLSYYMGKTEKERSLKLFPQALNILKLYEAKKENDSDYIFPFLDNKAEYSKLISPEDFQKAKPDLIAYLFKKIEARISICNRGLKELAKMAKINKRLTNHIARHSFADIARKKGISVYDISKLLGHSKTGITERYLSSFDIESQDSAHESVFSKSVETKSKRNESRKPAKSTKAKL